MKIVDEGKIAAFGTKHPPARSPLARWQEITADAKWKNPIDMKQLFPSADLVGPQTVFNIGGNKYRLIASISYRVQLVLVDDVLTHSDYSQGVWKQ